MVEQGQSTIAVDFGTTTSFVARRAGPGPAVIQSLSATTPWLSSIAAYDGTDLIVGDEENYTQDQLIRSAKQAITERWYSLPVGGSGMSLAADDVITAILSEIRYRIGEDLPESEIRMGCPAMWDGAQRKRLIQNARRAGLPVTDATLIDEPVAAGLAWLADQELMGGEPISGRVLVFDMGGGTLDVAVLEIASEDVKEVSVLSSRGNPMAGDQLDDAITAHLIEAVEDAGVDFDALMRPAQAIALIARLAREAKIALSTQELHTVVLPRAAFGKLLEIDFTRAQLEAAFLPMMERAEQVVAEALMEAQLKERYRETAPRTLENEIDYILLVGGMSQIPFVRKRLADRFPRVEFVARDQADPVEAVAKGLTDNTGYERINLHRPAFDFVLEWNNGSQRRLLYEAYTPLYQESEATSGRARLNYERRSRGMRLPRWGQGHLRVLSPSGVPVRLAVDGAAVDRLPVRFGLHELVFRIYCDGQLFLVDGLGRQTTMRVDRWPVIQDRDDDAALEMRKQKRKPADAPPVWFAGRQ